MRTLTAIAGIGLLTVGLDQADPWLVLVGLWCFVYWLLSERDEG